MLKRNDRNRGPYPTALRLFLVSNMYPSPENPSCGVFVKNICDGLERQGMQFPHPVVRKGVPATPLELLFSYVLLWLKTVWFGVRYDYSFVYAHFATHTAPPVLLLHLVLGKRCIVNVHGRDVIPTNTGCKLLQPFARLLVRHAALTVAPSEFMKRRLVEVYGADPGSIEVSPSGGIDTTLFRPSESKKCTEHYSVGFVSRIDERKGWRLLPEIVRELRERDIPVQMVVAGGGGDLPKLKNDVVSKDLSSFFDILGNVRYERLPTIYSRLDVLLLPTLYEESLCLVALEAMACGVPVVASAKGALKDNVVDEVNGYAVQPGNSTGFVERLEYLYRNPNLLEALSSSARRTVLHFDSEKVTKEIGRRIHSLAVDEGILAAARSSVNS